MKKTHALIATLFLTGIAVNARDAQANTTNMGSSCYGVTSAGAEQQSASLVSNNWGIHNTSASNEYVYCPLSYQFVGPAGLQNVVADVWHETNATQISCTLYVTDRTGLTGWSGTTSSVGTATTDQELAFTPAGGYGFASMMCMLPGAAGGGYNYISAIITY